VYIKAGASCCSLFKLRSAKNGIGSMREHSMSALGQKQTCRSDLAISALPPKADTDHHSRDVRFVPKADIAELPDLLLKSQSDHWN
jgi:hypothetical protein